MLYSSWCSVWNWTVVVASTVSEAMAWYGVTSNGRRRRGVEQTARRRLPETNWRGRKEEGPLTHLQMTPPAKSRKMLRHREWPKVNNSDFLLFKKLERERLLLFCYWVKNYGEKRSRIFYFKILLTPSELLLPNANKSTQKDWIELAG